MLSDKVPRIVRMFQIDLSSLKQIPPTAKILKPAKFSIPHFVSWQDLTLPIYGF